MMVMDGLDIKHKPHWIKMVSCTHYGHINLPRTDVGMFISRDPIGLMGGNNVFAYAPNPIEWVDPFGLQSFKSQNWGKILENVYKVPKTNASYHAHHIVFKAKYASNPKIALQLMRSKAILKKYNININSKANLMWAPNKGHSAKNAKKVADALVKADKEAQRLIKCCNMSRKQAKKHVEASLQKIGRKIWLKK